MPGSISRTEAETILVLANRYRQCGPIRIFIRWVETRRYQWTPMECFPARPRKPPSRHCSAFWTWMKRPRSRFRDVAWTHPQRVGLADGTYWMVTLLARGGADCDGTDCTAEALVSEQVSNFGAAAGGRSPAVPLTTKSTFPPSGSAEIVPNPNAGGVGVPISVWMPVDKSCQGSIVLIDPSGGSWATCEMHEWYGTDLLPEDYACPGNCSCSKMSQSATRTAT